MRAVNDRYSRKEPGIDAKLGFLDFSGEWNSNDDLPVSSNNSSRQSEEELKEEEDSYDEDFMFLKPKK